MKAAAAVLGASLLFFLGVLTGTGRRESVPPPVAIPLGVVGQSSGAGSTPPSSPDRPQGATPTTRSTAGASSGSGSPAAPSRPPSPSPSDPSGPSGTGTTPGVTVPPAAVRPVSPGSPGTPPATAAPPADSSTTPTSAGPGEVEEVDSEVDCRKGKGRRESCPPTTATTRAGDQPGGGRDR